MAYTRYNPVVRWVIKRISKRRGGPVDTSRDHEVTDWAQVRRFVDAVSSLVDRSAAVDSCDANT
jgi:menaquinone-dependent protoporphyrinogen oxidase